jgi:hypothetical protein
MPDNDAPPQSTPKRGRISMSTSSPSRDGHQVNPSTPSRKSGSSWLHDLQGWPLNVSSSDYYVLATPWFNNVNRY